MLVVEIDARRLSRIAPDGARTTVAALERGAPNGAAIGPKGAVYVCNNGGMHVVAMPDGARVPVGAAHDHSGGSIDRVDLLTGAVTTYTNVRRPRDRRGGQCLRREAYQRTHDPRDPGLDPGTRCLWPVEEASPGSRPG